MEDSITFESIFSLVVIALFVTLSSLKIASVISLSWLWITSIVWIPLGLLFVSFSIIIVYGVLLSHYNDDDDDNDGCDKE